MNMKKKVLTVIIVILFLSVIFIMGYTCYTNNQESGEYCRNYNEYLGVVESDEGLAIKNMVNGKIMGHYDFLLPYYADMDAVTSVVVKDNLRGYISSVTGEMIFEPQFRYAWLDNGENALAACVNQEGRMGFVNVETREVAIPFQYDFNEDILCPYSQPVYDFVFCNGLCIVPDSEGNLGLIDENGELVLPIEYSDIINWRDEYASEIILERKTEEDGIYRYGICDRSFNMLLPLEYDSIERVWRYDYLLQKRSCVYIVLRNGRYGLLDGALKQILPLEYDNIYEDTEIDGIVAVKNYVPQLYSLAGVLLNDFYAMSEIAYDGESGEYIDVAGFESVPEPFSDEASGYIQYYLDGCYGIIDGNKKVIIPARYDEIRYLGKGNFTCSIDGITYLIHDNR